MVYLLHATTKHKHAQHYIGWTQNKSTLRQRLQHHASGNGSKFIKRVQEARKERSEEPWVLVLARLWEDGTKDDEKKLKAWHKSRKLCPVCRGELSIDECKSI